MTDSNDPLVSSIRDLRLSVDQLRTELVRKDVYEAERETDRAEVAGLREAVTEVKGTLTWLSRTIVASLLLPVLTSALVIYVIQQGAR